MEEKKMSASEAVRILMQMMNDETLGVEKINAINMGINQIMHHYCGRMRNRARRFEAADGTYVKPKAEVDAMLANPPFTVHEDTQQNAEAHTESGAVLCQAKEGVKNEER